MNTAPKLTVMSDSRFAQAPATPAIEVLSAEKIYSNGNPGAAARQSDHQSGGVCYSARPLRLR